jgi:hypothetical protein
MCNCEFCIECDNCGHKADEHFVGMGYCFMCDCSQHESKIISAWERLNPEIKMSLQEFIDKWTLENGKN